MKRKLRNCIYALDIIFCSFATLNASEKIYIDSNELDTEFDAFHIHQGDNVWIQTNRMNRDATGLFIYENDIIKSPRRNGKEVEAEKTWKCPYCYRYWPIGTTCQNKDCPSRYR